MKGPLAQLMLLTVVIGLFLWVGVRWFVYGTDDLASTLNVRSLAYLRDGDSAGSSRADNSDDSAVAAMTEPVQLTSDGLQKPKTVASKQGAQVQQGNDAEEAEDGSEDALEVQQESDDSDQIEDSELPDRSNDRDAQQDQSARLTEEEITAREAARRQRLAELGLVPEKRPEPTIAIDVSLIMPDVCKGFAIARVPVGLKFRYESSSIKGESLNALESLVSFYRECGAGEFILAQNPLGRTDATETLIQMRFDEVKYFFIQHSVSIDAVQFPEK